MSHTPIHPSEVIAVVPRDEEEEPTPKDDIRSMVRRQIEEAENWRKQHLDPVQEKATDYYRGEKYGDEEEGRSQVVTTEVQDAVQSILPSLMRVFFGSERVVEFKPYGPEDVEAAEQATDYINYLVQEENEGFKTFYSAFKDALLRKQGIIKWWWEEQTQVEGFEATGLDAESVAALRLKPDVQVELINATEEQLLGEDEPPEEGFAVEILRIEEDGRIRLEDVPPEEFIFSPNAESVDDSLMVGHVRDVPADELVAMGIPRATVKKHKGTDDKMRQGTGLAASRRVDDGAYSDSDVAHQDATRPVRFAEIYTRIDANGDGITELRKIQALGEMAEIVNGDGRGEVVDMAPFAVFEVDPEPHTFLGMSVADRVMSLQRIKSDVTRKLLDSLTATLHPTTEVNTQNVNMGDVLKTEMGKIVRVRNGIGQMREVTVPFVGKEALPVLQYLDDVGEKRLGQSQAAEGLNADALQSSTASAVQATISAAQDRKELIARLLAETGMKRLMKGLLKLVVQHQPREQVMRLRNKWVPVDPASWNADMDVIVNVALGTGLVEDKMRWLGLIASKQEQLIQQGAPLTSLSKLRNTYARMVELAGFRNPNEFFQPFGQQEEQQFAQQQAQQAQEPTTEEQLVQIEAAKIQQSQQEKMAEMQLEAAKLALEREKVARELALDEAELDLKGQKEATDAAIEQARTQIEAATKGVDALKKMSETRVGE